MSAPDVDATDVEAVVEVLRSGRLALGPCAIAFERAVADYVGVRHAVAVSSGTAALHLILRGLGVGRGDDVLVPSFTFAATVNAILFEGARPVFVDITPDDLAADPADVRQKLTPRTRALIAVDVFGHPADWDGLAAAFDGRDVAHVADACEALGAIYRGRRVGSLGRAATFGFYPNKQITTGEGGMIVTDDAALAAAARSMRNQGRADTGSRLEHTRLGYNYRLDEMSAALGRSQMRRIDALLERRATVARAYGRALDGISGLAVPHARPDVTVSWFVYVVTLDRGVDRAAFMNALADRGIPTRAYFPPVHLLTYVRERLGTAPGDLPVTEDVAARTVALPFHGAMTEAEVARVAAACREALDVPEMAALVRALDSLVPGLDGTSWPAPVDGRVVLVTGAAGSIGAAVCRRCLAAGAARVVLADVDENGLYFAARRFEREGVADRVVVEIANVREASRIRALLAVHAPTLVLHAAAHKHVPLLERAPAEAVRNNVLATATLCDAASDAGAAVVLVSTDKAVAPTSVLGATKRVAEMIVQSGPPSFRIARTGNVLGSAGSVVPLFIEQIECGGPVTVTHRDATRYFCRIEDAAALVVAAAAPGHGPLLLTDPGAPLPILRLAETLIAAAGRPVPIAFVGLRPGEKLHETLLSPAEAATATALAPHLVRATAAADPSTDLAAGLEALRAAARAESAADVRATLAAIVPDYAPADS